MNPPDYTDLSICVDCLALIANGTLGQGDDGADAAHGHAMRYRWPDHHIVPACSEGCEGHFSWSSCQGCGSRDGGDRHPAVAFAIVSRS